MRFRPVITRRNALPAGQSLPCLREGVTAGLPNARNAPCGAGRGRRACRAARAARRPGAPGGQRGWAMSIGGLRAGAFGVVIAAGVALPAVLLSACGGAGLVGSGTAATQARHVAAFSRVALAGSATATIHAGGAQSVVVH